MSVVRQAEIPRIAQISRTSASQMYGDGFAVQMDVSEAQAFEHIMAPQDWDTVTNEFELGVGAGAMASFVEPYMPFNGRLP